jgi:hypothetical protein
MLLGTLQGSRVRRKAGVLKRRVFVSMEVWAVNEWNPSKPRNPSVSQMSSLEQAEVPGEGKSIGQKLLAWWYRSTTPDEASGTTSLSNRGRVRRARLASTLLLLITLIWLVSIPVFFVTLGSDPATLPVTVVGLLVIALLLFLNRRGWVAVVAWLLIGMIYLSELLILRNNGATLGTNEVAVFDLLVYAELLAVSLLPALSVFPVALTNCAFIMVAVFTLQPSSSDSISHPAYVTNLLIEPLTLQLFVALVTYLWVASAEREIARADQAEQVADLERRAAEDRRQVDADTQQLLGTLTRVANGDVQARVALSQDRTLWQVGVALNTLLARLQGTDAAEYTLRRTEEEVAVLVGLLRDAKAGRATHWPQPGDSVLAPLIRELVDTRFGPASSRPSTPRMPRLPEDHPGSEGKTRPIGR